MVISKTCWVWEDSQRKHDGMVLSNTLHHMPHEMGATKLFQDPAQVLGNDGRIHVKQYGHIVYQLLEVASSVAKAPDHR